VVGKSNQPRDERGRWVAKGGGAGVVLAVVLGIAAATSGGGAGAAGAAGTSSSAGSGSGGGGGSSSSSAAQSPSGRSSTTKGTARGKARDRDTGRVIARLARQGLRVRERGARADTDCAAHSYGQVRVFFQDHPCTALFRALLEGSGTGR